MLLSRKKNRTEKIHLSCFYSTPPCKPEQPQREKNQNNCHAFDRKSSILFTAFPEYAEGSLTVEAAVALPVCLMFMSAFLLLFGLLSAELKLQLLMKETVKSKASGGVQELLSERKIREKLKDGWSGELTVRDGAEGISFFETAGDREEEVTLLASYYLNLPYFPGAVFRTRITQRSTCRRFTGKAENRTSGKEKPVYVTENGEVYHTSVSCSYLNPSVHSCSRDEIGRKRNASGEIYDPCSYCCSADKIQQNEAESRILYYTTYGECYHLSRNCTALKRGVKDITLRQAEEQGMPCCSKCAENRSG